jgi:hypothetical protein
MLPAEDPGMFPKEERAVNEVGHSDEKVTSELHRCFLGRSSETPPDIYGVSGMATDVRMFRIQRHGR